MYMTQQTLPIAGIYTLDPERTTIRCDCKALMGLMTVHGTFQLNEGRVTITEDPAGCGALASVAAGSFASGLSMRDTDVISMLQAGAYPEISFDGTGARPDGAGWVLTGSVTAHGATQPVDVRVSDVTFENRTARFHATATLDRFSFGITTKKLRVGRTVNLIIDAAAALA
jgi:polyisoprenoid-binding protein YceI